MRHHSRMFFASLVLLLILAAWGNATTLVYLSVEDLTLRADDVVIARVAETRSYMERDGRTIFTAVTLEVRESLQGATSPGQRITLHHLGGEVDGLALHYAAMPSFEPGRDVAVFLRHLGADAYGLVGLAQGVFEVREQEGRWVAVRTLSSLHFAEPMVPGGATEVASREDELLDIHAFRSLVRQAGPGPDLNSVRR